MSEPTVEFEQMVNLIQDYLASTGKPYNLHWCWDLANIAINKISLVDIPAKINREGDEAARKRDAERRDKIVVSSKNFHKQLLITNDIDKKLKTINFETGIYATHHNAIKHPDFIALVNMGTKIIPYLFHLITYSSASWTHFLLLHSIVPPEEKMVQPKDTHGDYIKTLMYWLDWYSNSKYSDSDVYYGLVNPE